MSRTSLVAVPDAAAPAQPPTTSATEKQKRISTVPCRICLAAPVPYSQALHDVTAHLDTTVSAFLRMAIGRLAADYIETFPAHLRPALIELIAAVGDAKRYSRRCTTKRPELPFSPAEG